MDTSSTAKCERWQGSEEPPLNVQNVSAMEALEDLFDAAVFCLFYTEISMVCLLQKIDVGTVHAPGKVLIPPCCLQKLLFVQNFGQLCANFRAVDVQSPRQNAASGSSQQHSLVAR